MVVPRLRLLALGVLFVGQACTSAPRSESSGIPVAAACGILLAVLVWAVERWDTNRDGMIESTEAIGLAAEVSATLAAAIAAGR